MTHCDHCDSHEDSSGFTSGFLLGLVVGGAGGYLLSTEKGKEILANLKENAGEKLQEVIDNPAIADKIADLEATMTKARQEIHEKTAPKKNFFQRMGSPLGK